MYKYMSVAVQSVTLLLPIALHELDTNVMRFINAHCLHLGSYLMPSITWYAHRIFCCYTIHVDIHCGILHEPLTLSKYD